MQSEKNESLYFGSTNNIQRRMKEHGRGKSVSTRSGRPWKLVHVFTFENVRKARHVEQALKAQKKHVTVSWFREMMEKERPA